MKVKMLLNQDDYRRRAKRILPSFVFDYVDGGAEREETLNLNQRVFEQWQFIPPVLKDASTRQLSLTLAGRDYAAPILIAPTGYNGMLCAQETVSWRLPHVIPIFLIFRAPFQPMPLKRLRHSRWRSITGFSCMF
ncbi:alpha-hydroxy-acid oxidizing protein [Vibrio sp. PP-XX7]